MMLITAAAVVSAGCNTNHKVNNGENGLMAISPKIPPIDMLAPVKTETATFALD
jgi:hypothetical protein